jgi:triosephosphate isomerase
MRPRIVAGNWKMFTHRETARQLADGIVKEVGNEDRVQVVVCPPFPYLGPVGDAVAGSRVALGAQNCYDRNEGAFTGEVSPSMLIDLGCKYVILGHSERRHILGESDALIAAKVPAALKVGLKVILCVGQTLEEHQAGRINSVFARQVWSALADVDPSLRSNVLIAYEPVWAIGTGHAATPEQAQQAHAFIRKQVSEMGGGDLPILYGGSVKADNARGLFSQPDVDGGLIGGASLKADQFTAIVRAALP